MDPNELTKLYLDTWLGFYRAFTSGGGHDQPFSEEECAGPTHPQEEREDFHARRYLSVLNRLNRLSDAQAKIGHAWAAILLNRLDGFVSDPHGREKLSRQRKTALDELLNGYVALSTEYVGAWTEFFAAMTNARPAR